uniref:hypothetical protein n=1 Tax=Streptomyces djakartensis TaxID=68193 RepID=UPI0034DF1519
MHSGLVGEKSGIFEKSSKFLRFFRSNFVEAQKLFQKIEEHFGARISEKLALERSFVQSKLCHFSTLPLPSPTPTFSLLESYTISLSLPVKDYLPQQISSH